MPIPELNVSVDQSGLGAVTEATTAHLNIGACSAGPVGVVLPFGDETTLRSTFGAGALVELMAHKLDIAGAPVLGMRVSTSNAGTNGTVAHTGTGQFPGVTPSGAPLDDIDVVVQIVKGGAVGAATFKASLDGGDNFSAEFASAASVAVFAVDTGLTLAFATGVYVAGDLYSWHSTGPTYSSSDLAAALDTAKTTGQSYELIHVVGTVGGANDGAKITNWIALLSAISTKLTSMFNFGRYTGCIVEAPDVADSAFDVGTVANFVDMRIIPCAGFVELDSSITSDIDKRPAAWPVAARLNDSPPNESPGWVERGSLEGVSLLYRDEFKTPSLGDLRITTLRTFGDSPKGFYVTDGRTFAAIGSDFAFVQYLRLINRGCTVARAELVKLINADLAIDPATGFLDEVEAAHIETIVNGKLETALVKSKQASGTLVQLPRNTNLLSIPTLPVIVRIIPRAVVRNIDLSIGLLNPVFALSSAALAPTAPSPTSPLRPARRGSPRTRAAGARRPTHVPRRYNQWCLLLACVRRDSGPRQALHARQRD